MYIRRLAIIASIAVAASVVVATDPSTAAPSSLPTVTEGPRPGPAVLYQPLPKVPELSVTAPFKAGPLLVSGTDSYCKGDYLYQDYLFDDHGANTSGSYANGGEFGIFPPAGDLQYPDEKRYARNAADIVEFRVRPTSDALVFRVTLNTVLTKNVTAIGIGIDRDRSSTKAVSWPYGAGLATPGLDAFVTAWGTGGTVKLGTTLHTLPSGAVAMDITRNQMTISVPKTLLDPKAATWRFVAGAGLWTGKAFRTIDDEAPAIFNLAFRFDEKQGGDNRGNTVIGYGNWFDESQGAELADGTTGTAFTDVSFAKLTDQRCRFIHAPKRDQARIFASRLSVPEGVHAGAKPNFGGRLQPYMLHLPPKSSRPPGLVLALHGNSATYTQWAVVTPNYHRQVGDERNSVILSPLGRSTQGTGIVYDWFEAWADASRRVALDSERAAISGYSAGGYNTFVAGTLFPDLFGGAFSIVGAARLLNGGARGDHTNMVPMLGNMRWVPTVSWNQLVDELAPYIGIRGTHDELNALGLRNALYTFPVGEHFTPGLLDNWQGGADYLGQARVTRDPARVDFTITPSLWGMLSPDAGPDKRFPAGHIVADHAYWVSSLQTRDATTDNTGQVRGTISATSYAFGQGTAPTSRDVGLYAGPPAPATVDGMSWGPAPRTAPRNELAISLANLRNAVIWGTRARLSAFKPLTVRITSDGDAMVRIVLPFSSAPRISTSGAAAGGAFDSKPGIVLRVRKGTSRFVLTPG